MNFKIDIARKIAGGIALAGLGLLAFDLAPAAAQPPYWAPARGYRRHNDTGWNRYSTYRRRDYGYGDRYYNGGRYYDSSRYSGGRYYGTRGGTRGEYGDLDGDGIINRRDWDRDGDGVPNRRDDHPSDRRRR